MNTLIDFIKSFHMIYVYMSKIMLYTITTYNFYLSILKHNERNLV
jgi:hypothetical protein